MLEGSIDWALLRFLVEQHLYPASVRCVFTVIFWPESTRLMTELSTNDGLRTLLLSK